MKKLLLLLLPLHLFAEVYSDTIGLVQFASDDSIVSRKDQASPGVIQATELQDSGNNTFAALTVGLPSGRRVPVQDRYALHRVPYENIDYPNFYFSLGEYTCIKDDYTVSVFTNFCVPGTGTSPEQDTYTHSFRIVPNNGYYITAVEWTKTGTVTPRPDIGDGLTFVNVHVTCVDGTAYVEASVKSQQDTKTYDIDVKITKVRAVRGELNTMRDDLTQGDYYFTDSLGNMSLGSLRRWVKDQYDKYKANLWAEYPANQRVDLAENILKFSREYYTVLGQTENPNDTLTLYHNGTVALRFVGGSHGTNGTFRIVGIDVSSNDDYNLIYTTTSDGEPYCIYCTDLLDQAWYRPSGQIVTLTSYKNETSYCIMVPKTDDKAGFFRAVAPGNGGNGSPDKLITEFPVYSPSFIMKGTDGNWWALKIVNGTVSAVSTNAPIAE